MVRLVYKTLLTSVILAVVLWFWHYSPLYKLKKANLSLTNKVLVKDIHIKVLDHKVEVRSLESMFKERKYQLQSIKEIIHEDINISVGNHSISI